MNRNSLKLIVVFALLFSFGTSSLSFADEKKKDKNKEKPAISKIKVKTEPGSYPIYIDGKYVGDSSPDEAIYDVEPGQREVEIRFSDTKIWKKTETFLAGRPVCLCFKKTVTKISTPCPHLVQVDVADAITEGDLVTFTSNVNVNPNPQNISPALVNFNDFKAEDLAYILKERQTPAAQCVYNRFSPKTKALLDNYQTGGSTTAISRADFKNAALLAIRLRTAADPISVLLKDKLSSSTRKLVNNFDGSGLSGEVPADLLNGLITDFNKIISSGSIYDKDRFMGVRLSSETERLKNQTSLDAESTKRLNRLLLEDAFPNEFQRSSSGNQGNLELTNALADEFNLLIKGPVLTNEACFSGVQMSAATKKLSAGGLTGEGVRSFNRLLLEDAFPNQITKLGSVTAQFNTPVRYIWTVSPSNARIIGPSDRDSITVDSTGFGDQAITAQLMIDDGRDDNLCRQMDNASTKVKKIIPPTPKRWRHDEFPSRAYDDVKARLDTFVTELQSKPDSKGYIVVYSGVKSKPAQTQKLNAKVIDYLVKDRSFPPERIVVIQGGKRDDDFVELWVVENGATPPGPNSNE